MTDRLLLQSWQATGKQLGGMKHGIDRSDLERIAEALSKAAVPAEKEVSKFEAIETLAAAIARMRKRGHSLDSVVSFLAEQQIPISVGTLKTYLHRLKKKRLAEAGASPKRARQQQADHPKTAALKDTTTNLERAVNVAVTGRQINSSKAHFVVREDTEEI